MNPTPAPTLSPLLWTLLVGVFAVVLLVAFKGWVAHGAEIFLAMAESGMAWCF